jgi:hypothetical protein
MAPITRRHPIVPCLSCVNFLEVVVFLVRQVEFQRVDGSDLSRACFEVHKEMGCGFLAPVYQECLKKEPRLRDMSSIKSRSSYSEHLLPFFVVFCLIGVFIVPDAMILPLLRKYGASMIFGAIEGSVIAQGCLLAAWMAWSDQRFWRRSTWHWTLVAIPYLFGLAGLYLSFLALDFAQVSSFLGLSLPLASISAQTPLWIARHVLGWRLVRENSSSDIDSVQLSIRGLMAATLIVSLALALARIAPSPIGKELAWTWIAIFVTSSTISTITMMPACALLLRTEHVRRGMILAGLYLAFWVGLPWLMILEGLTTGNFPVRSMRVGVGASSFILSFAVTVAFAAAVARSHGYRLFKGVSRHVAAPSQAPVRPI